MPSSSGDGAVHRQGESSAKLNRNIRQAPARRVWRGFAVGALLLPFNVVWLLYTEHIYVYGVIPTTISLFFNVVFILFFLALANLLARRIAPRLALNQSELIIVYVMLTISSSAVAYDNLQVLIPSITHAFWFANPTNRWDQAFAEAPIWLVVSDPKVLEGYFNGSSTMYQWPIISAWLSPTFWWTGFAVVLIFVMICLSVLVRQQWADRERLTFPIVQLPMALTEPGTTLWRSKLLWIGFAAAAAVDVLNGLHYLYPSVPYLRIAPTVDNWGANDITSLLPDLPWRAIGWLPVTFYPAVIGIAFLVPLDILFSCIVFFFFWKLMFVLAAATGVSQGWGSSNAESVFPYANRQMFGGYLAIAVGPLLVGRSYFRAVWNRIVGRPSEVSDAGEGLSYRVAAIGIVAGISLLVWFSAHGGMHLWLAVPYFVIYYLLALAVARVRAEFGSPVHDFHQSGPGVSIPAVLGTANMTRRDLTMFAMLWWLNRAYRGHPIGHTIEGLQMSARARSRSRVIVAAMVLAAALGMIAGFWAWMHYAYTLGVVSKWSGSDWQGTEICEQLQSQLENPQGANLGLLLAMAGGFGITLLLGAARTAIVGWPLHPVAYALAASWSIHLVWMPMLIALLVKSSVLRYGGLRLYRQALPFFFGLILGETVVGMGWTLIGMVLNTPVYGFWGL